MLLICTVQYSTVSYFSPARTWTKSTINCRGRTFRRNICTFLEKGMKTETTISSGFRMVFPKLTKKSWFRGTSRLPPGGFRSEEKLKRLTWIYIFEEQSFCQRSSLQGKNMNLPFETTLTLQLPAAKTGFRSEFGYALMMLPPRD